MSLTLDTSGWVRVSLGSVAIASREQVDPSDGTVDRYVAGEHMDTDDLKIHRWGDPTQTGLGPAFHRRFRPGQVLYGSRRTYLRKVAVADFDGVCANTTFVVESRDTTVLSQEFLPFVMSAEPFHAFAIAESKGSVNPYVNWSDIDRYEFDLPPLAEQRRIADLLWAIEDHARSVETSQVAHGLGRSHWFEEALARGVDSNDWRIDHVPALVTEGPTNGKSAPANDEGRGVPTLSISAIRDGRVRGGSSVKYMDVESSAVAKFVIEKGDFLIVRGNGNKQLTGRGGVAGDGLPAGCVYPDLLIRLRFDPTVILTAFAAEQWNSVLAHDALTRRAKSTNGIWKINGQDIRAHQLIVPPLGTQRELLDRVSTLGRAVDAMAGESAALQELRQSVLAEIFGGN